MKNQIRFPISVAIVLVLGAVAFAQQIKVDYDHHADFSQFKTYSWAKVETPDTLWDQRVKDAVDRTLAANLGISGVESRSRHRRRASART